MAASNAAQSSTPCCLYCGYDRTGLDEDRRCPECGLRSVPEEFRRETQAVFDSRRRLYREGLRWFSKHPPGWFWSLDRPGDLRRSVWLVGMNIVLCLLIINAGVILGDLCWLRIVHEGAWYNPTDPAAPVVAAYRHTAYLGFAFRVRSEDAYNFDQWRDQPPGYALRWSLTARPIWNGSPRWHPVALIVPTWLVMVYVFLAFGGICSQLRKGLPSYARPLTSVTVAVNAASCRLPMQAASCLLLVAVEVVSDTDPVSAMREVVAQAARYAADGDRVILAPAAASLDMYTGMSQRGDLFAEFANALPNALPNAQPTTQTTSQPTSEGGE